MNTAHRYYIQRNSGLLLLFCFCLASEIFGQRVPGNEITDDMGFTIHSVKIRGRWVPKELQAKVEQFYGIGQPLDHSKMMPAQVMVENELIKYEEQFGYRILKGSTSVLVIYTDYNDVSETGGPKEVEIIISPYYLRVDLFNAGKNVLPIPRTAKPSFYEKVPAFFLVANPFISFTTDRRYGPAIGISTLTDLLHIPRAMKLNSGSKSLRLDLGLDARKSLDNPFYTVSAALDLVHPVYSDTSIGWNIAMRYYSSSQPVGEDNYEQEGFMFRAAIQGSTKSKLLNKYIVGGGARFLESRNDTKSNLQNDESGFEIFAVADSRPGKYFRRIGLLFDAGMPDKSSGFENYQRLAGRIAYSLHLGNGHNNVGVETGLGAGYAWGSPPEYNRFFAGNTSWNFLYEPITSIHNSLIPGGPVLRSLGVKQGGLTSPATNTITGGTSFWHFSLNVSIPVSKWSYPLVPDVVITDEPRVITLRSALKAQSKTAQEFIYDDMVKNGFPDDDETDKKADQIVNKDIRPTLNYLADRANVYAIKPVILFDIAHINDRDLKGRTWTAAGLGIQLTVVIASLELGYMHTLSPASDASKGNFLMRMIFQNFY